MTKRKDTKKQSKLDFRFMSFFIRIRDTFRHPSIKIEKAKIKQGDIVLDYGCGPGSYALVAADVVGPYGKVIAADINPLAIDKVRKKATKIGLQNIEMVITDCKTDLDAESIDAIICFDVIHGINDKDCILNEFHRLLKLNSKLSFDDHHMKEEEIILLLTGNGLFELEEKIGKLYNFKKKI